MFYEVGSVAVHCSFGEFVIDLKAVLYYIGKCSASTAVVIDGRVNSEAILPTRNYRSTISQLTFCVRAAQKYREKSRNARFNGIL